MIPRNYKYHPYIDDYIQGVNSGEIIVDDDILLAANLVEQRLNNTDVFIDGEKIDKAVELIEKYFDIKLFDWELFVVACIHCYYKSNDTVVFNEFLIYMGRGNGKNGFISGLAWYLTTPNHGIIGYNVDIIANSEDQAKTSFDDVYDMLENHWSKLKHFYYKSKELIKSLKTKSYIKFNTSNARTKDGKRSACLVFDELHEAENYDNISVMTSGFGKRKHSRIFKITTNGHVREGVLDNELAIAKDVLNGTITELGLLPLLYHISNVDEALNPKMWHKANPSLKYLPELQKEIEKEFVEMKYKVSVEQDFYTKRMNWPKSNREVAVTDWENIAATNQPIPDITSKMATVGIDYSKLNDMAAVNFHFRKGDIRIDINHAWLCLQSADLKRLKIPWKQWDEEGYITLVDDVEIKPELLAEYIADLAKEYEIRKLALDNYRYALLAQALQSVGFDAKERKNVVLVRPTDIMKVHPVIESCFNNHFFIWGDNPCLRWAANNTKSIASGRKAGTDTGNYYYGKIEAKSRKTDPFMALVHSMTIEECLGTGETPPPPDVGVFTY